MHLLFPGEAINVVPAIRRKGKPRRGSPWRAGLTPLVQAADRSAEAGKVAWSARAMAHWPVTGGAGSIGGHLAVILLARGGTVLVLDGLSTGRLPAPWAPNPSGATASTRPPSGTGPPPGRHPPLPWLARADGGAAGPPRQDLPDAGLARLLA